MEYKGVIWTKHILERMKERGLSYDDVYWVFRKPASSTYAQGKNAWKFYRNHKGLRLAVVASKNKDGVWVMMTCWTKQLGGLARIGHGRRKKVGFLKELWKLIRSWWSL